MLGISGKEKIRSGRRTSRSVPVGRSVGISLMKQCTFNKLGEARDKCDEFATMRCNEQL